MNLRTCTQALATGFRLRFGCDETSTATFLQIIIGKNESGLVEMKQSLETKQRSQGLNKARLRLSYAREG